MQKTHHGNFSYLFLLVVLVAMRCAHDQVRGPSDVRDWGDYAESKWGGLDGNKSCN